MMRDKNKGFLIVGGVFLFLFLLVALMSSTEQGMLLDENVGYWASGIESSLVLNVMKLISVLGSTSAVLVITVLIGLVFLIKRNWNYFFFFFTVSVGGVILNLALKMLIQRERPGDVASNIEVFNFEFDIPSYSFPSGHTMRATILFLFLAFLASQLVRNSLVKYGAYVVCVVLVLLVALSRVLLDAHFVTDILGAMVMSVAWFSLCGFVFIRRKEQRHTYLNR